MGKFNCGYLSLMDLPLSLPVGICALLSFLSFSPLTTVAAPQPTPPQKEDEAVKIPKTRMLFDSLMRDPSICLGDDGIYYLTGTTGNVWTYNEGIELWRSKDLVNWESLGRVWDVDKEGEDWQRQWVEQTKGGKPTGKWRRVVWAPEIHYLKGTYWLAFCMPGHGLGLLKSTTGKPTGPYKYAVVPGNQPLIKDVIDATLFEDDDGKVYLLYGAGYIARMKDDLSGLAEEPRQLLSVERDADPKNHAGHCKQDFNHIGFEGPFLFKVNGRYQLACAEYYQHRYSCMMASSDTIYGPYSPRYEAIPQGGHATFFKDHKGQWWSACFETSHKERPGILAIDFGQDGKLIPAPEKSGGIAQ